MPRLCVDAAGLAGARARYRWRDRSNGACFFFSSRRRHTRFDCDWSSDVCSSDLVTLFASQGSLTEKVAQLWWPYGWRDEDWAPRGRWMSAIGRLKPGVSLTQAQTEMNGLVASFTKVYPDFETGWGVNLVPVHEEIGRAHV